MLYTYNNGISYIYNNCCIPTTTQSGNIAEWAATTSTEKPVDDTDCRRRLTVVAAILPSGERSADRSGTVKIPENEATSTRKQEMLVEDSPYCSQGQTTWGRPCASKSGRCRFPRGMDTTRGRKDLALLRLSSRPSKCRPQWRSNAKQDTWTVQIFVRSRKEGLGLVEVSILAVKLALWANNKPALSRLSSRPSKCRPQWRSNAKHDTWTVQIFVRSRKEGLGLVEVSILAVKLALWANNKPALSRLSSRPSKCRPQWRSNAKQDTWMVPIFVQSRKEGLGLVEVEQQAR
ncbi:uncharacterized protein LOC135938401 [Cloeon dipterum]|uniref:uncharacterized protein LOC135938401 n=1 Tax=Cloeon dipterum TaxID=197152 RepID=UPI00321FB0EE